eukprot:CAMPEP_0206490414 /NCGR_PEP_ID=MMETSP0324_2-20121206/44075_1 /ASSEMBLY_ACC=CAM_ASM_000836 /TAXON_ID=2866 /ORGANISM="Crypthecodinium cohnii, Strain Seligo" /LENGTH=59 /DNA_ID=CAMNT_0053970787 /DNA_START=29 /DNA_END=209 /DNA_ORIENTATION=-
MTGDGEESGCRDMIPQSFKWLQDDMKQAFAFGSRGKMEAYGPDPYPTSAAEAAKAWAKI